MKNMWRLFVGDLRRLRTNIVTIITVIGLVALPSIFSWYNMLACWNVFDNTGNLTVAVANIDEGYVSDLVPIEVNIGDRVVAALRANDQLNWVFTDEDDAVDGTRSGRYYAAVVIPESFSRDMMSFFSDETEHANIVYYSNEKKNAVAPKVTDQGADQVSRQVNLVFTETLSEVALGVSQALVNYTDDADADGAIATLSAHLGRVGTQMGEAGSLLELYAGIFDSAQALVEDSGAMLSSARAASRDVAHSADEANEVASGVPQTLEDATDALSQAIEESSASYAALPAAIDAAFDSADKLSGDTVVELRNQAHDIDLLIADYRALYDDLSKLEQEIGDADAKEAVKAIMITLDDSISLQVQLRDTLLKTAEDVENSDSSTQEDRAALAEIANQVKQDLDDASADYDENLAPVLEELADAMGSASTTLASAGEQIDASTGKLIGDTGSVSSLLSNARGEIATTAAKLESTGASISDLGARLSEAVAVGDTQAIRTIISTDPATLAQAISAPVRIERHAVFPIENFGSAMSPLYTTLALWIGALVMMVTLKLTPSKRTLEELDGPSPRQVLLGRFAIVAFISLLQSTTIALGNLFFLGVQAVNPWLYMLCFWVSGLVFAFIIYTLVALFANLGKALSVILLIVQVSGGGGSFPMQLLPDFFQAVSPYLPITHAVNAMRAAMFGLYANDFWIEIGVLALFAVPLLLAGLLLNAPLSHVVPKFVERVEKSKLM